MIFMSNGMIELDWVNGTFPFLGCYDCHFHVAFCQTNIMYDNE